MPVRHLWLAAALVIGACTSGAAEQPEPVSVGGVALVVPDGWSVQPTDTTPQGSDVGPEVVASRAWAAGEGVDNLQVVIGCGGTAADLARMAAQAPRDPLVVTDAVEVPAPDVPGLESAHRLRLTLGAGRQDDASTVQVDGLYGEVGDAIVLVEIAQRAGADHEVADEVLGSVEVTADTVRTACEGR